MGRKGVWVAAVVVLAAAGLYWALRTPTPTPDPEPPPLGGGGTELTIDRVEYRTPAGPRVVRPDGAGFTVRAAGVSDAVVVNGTNTAGAGSVTARLMVFDVADKVETPVGDLNVQATSPTGFRVELPAGTLKRATVYRIALAETGTGKQTRYQFNVSNE